MLTEKQIFKNFCAKHKINNNFAGAFKLEIKNTRAYRKFCIDYGLKQLEIQ